MNLPNLGALRLEPAGQPQAEPVPTEVLSGTLDMIRRLMSGGFSARGLPDEDLPPIPVETMPEPKPGEIRDVDVMNRASQEAGMLLWRQGAVMWSAADGSVKSLVSGAEATGWIQGKLAGLRELVRQFFSITMQLERQIDNAKAELNRQRPARSPDRDRYDRGADGDRVIDGTVDWPQVPVDPMYTDQDKVEIASAMGMIPQGKPGAYNVFFEIQPRHPEAYKFLHPWLTFIGRLANPESRGYDAVPSELGVRVLNPWFYKSLGWDREDVENDKEEAYYEALLTMRAGAQGYGPRIYAAQMGPVGMLMITEHFEMDLMKFLENPSTDPIKLYAVMNEVAAVVQAASLDGMLMCDLKPANVVLTLTPNGRKAAEVRMIDFDTRGTGFYQRDGAARSCITIMNTLCLLHAMNCLVTFASDIHKKRAFYTLAWMMKDAALKLPRDNTLCRHFLTIVYEDTRDNYGNLGMLTPRWASTSAGSPEDEFLRAARRALSTMLHYGQASIRQLERGASPKQCVDGLNISDDKPIVPQLMNRFEDFAPNGSMPGSMF
jgi:hypothetical protein